ncbi:MAG: FtsX-like permease family protein [Chloroflexi bacterium]|nr:FtsX-like permease family protein [Chloroflexota bacterium]
MLEQFRFYLAHSFNDLRVNRRLTIFALLSVAAGVAAIVSLQTLALMIANTLEVNLQDTNRGDVSVQVDFDEEDTALAEAVAAAVEAGRLIEDSAGFFGQSVATYALSGQGIDALQTWIDGGPYAGQIDFTYRIFTSDLVGIFTGSGTGTALTNVASGDQATQLQAVIIDKNVYPFYSDIATLAGESLAEVMQAPTDLVVGEETAELLELNVGDAVQLNGSSATFNVVGIASVENEVKGFSDFFAGVFGFYYLDWAAVELFDGVDVQAQDLYFQLADPAQGTAFAADLVDAFPYFETTTIEDLRIQNEELTEQIDTFVGVMGLISLLLGSIGIINTMQVIVRRRMLEVAVLKTHGLQSEQITLLFLTEALLVGIFGSVVGVLLGWGATIALREVVSGIFGSQITFVFAPVPAINGFVVGVVVATVFGFLPTLTAGQVRPNIVLRPTQGAIPRAGVLQSILALLIIIVSVSAIVTGIIGSDFGAAFGLVVGAFIAAGIIYLMLMLIIWLVGRFLPSFGFVDLKVSLRQMLVARSRGASTLLALAVGVFSLSTITLFAQSIGSILEFALEGTGGNVIISVPNFSQLDDVEAIIAGVEGVNSTSVSLAYNAVLASYTDSETGTTYNSEGVRQLVTDSDINFPPIFDGTEEERSEIQQSILSSVFLETSIQARDNFDESEAVFDSGRDITNDELDQPVLVLPANDILSGIGVNAGDRVTYEITSQGLLFGSRSEEVTFEIVGIRAASLEIDFSGAGAYAPAASFPEAVSPTLVTILVDVDDAQVTALRRALAEVPGIFAIETSILTRLISSVLEAFTAFPTMVAALGLIVGGVVIANSVALATMERRNEIAVMKSVGLQRERVLGMILLENGILGFIGGLIGVSFGLVALVAFAAVTQSPSSTVPFGTAFLLMLLCAGVALIAAVTSAWDASGEKPLTVLRYE